MVEKFSCMYCSFRARDNFNLTRHLNSNKCKLLRSGILCLDAETISGVVDKYLQVADLMDGQEGVACRLYNNFLKDKYKLLDSSRKKFQYYCSSSKKKVIDINCYKLRSALQPLINKKIEEWWIFFEPLPVFIQEKVLSNKELGNVFVKTILELAV
jgi:hypothetical protein